MKQYEQIFTKFQTGQITEKVWRRYCQIVFWRKLIPQHREMFVRMQNEWK